MKWKNQVEFEVFGNYALFTDPLTRVGGEKCSYPIPTYQALKGILESIYWKPTIIWYIDELRVMNPIHSYTHGIRTLKYHSSGKDSSDLFNYTYLRDVRYQVRAHFEWNERRTDLINDRNENKHFLITQRMIKKGGRRDIFLGTRECQGYVTECKFGEGKGYYDDVSIPFGIMFHGFTYPDEIDANSDSDYLEVRFWNAVMRNGYIKFIRPNECTITRVIRKMEIKKFDINNFSGLNEFSEGGELNGVDV
ncbi:MAG TPA: type I-C CRISPR-associated protein Cas5c [Haloplasmataceae bacterium]